MSTQSPATQAGSLTSMLRLKAQWLEGRGFDDSAQHMQEAADEIDRLTRELSKCGRENCMGQAVEGHVRWVREERLTEARQALAAAQAAHSAPVAVFIDGHEAIPGAEPSWVRINGGPSFMPSFKRYGLFPLTAPQTSRPDEPDARAKEQGEPT